MPKLFLRVILAACLPVGSYGLSAQQARPQPDKDLLKEYADEAAVVEKDEVLYRFNADGTGTRLETTAVRIQSGAALQMFAVLSLPYANGSQQLDIVYARVRKPDGTVVDTPATDVQDQPAPATQVAPMYSDLHIKQLPMRSLAIGDTLEVQTRATQTHSEIPGEFWGSETFGAGAVYLDRRIELRVPKSKSVTVYSPRDPPAVEESGEDRIYRWKGAQLRHSNAKPDDAPQAKDPDDKLAPIAWTTFPSWQAVGTWYQGLIAGRDAVTPALQAKADEVTAGAKTDTEKVQALYQYVSQHNHYIAVEFGIGKYQPHPAAEVLVNQYGDCKDKHTLLAALLRAKGFHPSAVLIGAGLDMNEKVPSPAAFNHLITFVTVDGAPIWLDATTEVAPYRVLLSMLRDKQALVVPEKGSPGLPHLAKTPAELPFPAVDRYEGNFDLAKDGTTKGNVTVSMRGDTELLMRYATRQAARAQWDQMGQAYVDGSGFNGKANTVTLDGGGDTSRPWELRYAYTQEPWSQWKSYQTGSLLPNVNVPAIDEKNPPKQDIDFGGRHIQTAKSTVRLPSGWGAELPNPIHLKTAFATFDETYRIDNGSLLSEFTLEVLKPKVDAADWKSVKKFADDIGTQPWIQLNSNSYTSDEKGPPRAGESNSAAAELIRQAHDAIMAKDFAAAQKKSDQAIALNEKQAYAWSERGWIAWQHHDLTEAATDYERELRQHPDEVDQYADLIRLEHLLKRPAEEQTFLLAYAKAAPDDPKAISFVGRQLLAENRVDDALNVYKTAAGTLPDNNTVQAGLSIALLRAGKKDEAHTALKKALDGDLDPGTMNDTAYSALTDGSADMAPLAETMAQKAVDRLEAQLAAVSIDQVSDDTLRYTHLLFSTWDTLGWAFFAQGKNDQAEQYVRGAWQNAQQGAEGLHLGQILERKGNTAGAMRVYEQALSQFRVPGTNTTATDLQARIDALRKKGVPVQDQHPNTSLQNNRVFHVPRPSGVKGSAVFIVETSGGKTQAVSTLSDDDGLRHLTNSLQKLDLGLVLPARSHTHMFRTGILFCSGDPTCDFVLTPPEAATVK